MTDEVLPEELHLGVSETKQQFSKIVNEVATGVSRVVVEKNGLPAAVMIDLASYKKLLAREAWQREADKMLKQIGERFADVPPEVHEAEVLRAVSEARAEYRAQRNAKR
ncbi:hypothetical protein BH09CHL1_BH09CHL1_06900 [soil metagenome]